MKQANDTKTCPVMVRMSPKEKAAAEKKARAKGLSLSAWLRMLAVTATAIMVLVGCGGSAPAEPCTIDAAHPWCVKPTVQTWASFGGPRPMEAPSAFSPANDCIGGWWPAVPGMGGSCVDVLEVVDGPLCRHDGPGTSSVVPAVGLYMRPCSTEQAIGCEFGPDGLTRSCWVLPGGWPML